MKTMKDDSILRVGIIGTGWIAEKAAITLNGLPTCKAYAVGSRACETSVNKTYATYETNDFKDKRK